MTHIDRQRYGSFLFQPIYLLLQIHTSSSLTWLWEREGKWVEIFFFHYFWEVLVNFIVVDFDHVMLGFVWLWLMCFFFRWYCNIILFNRVFFFIWVRFRLIRRSRGWMVWLVVDGWFWFLSCTPSLFPLICICDPFDVIKFYSCTLHFLQNFKLLLYLWFHYWIVALVEDWTGT